MKNIQQLTNELEQVNAEIAEDRNTLTAQAGQQGGQALAEKAATRLMVAEARKTAIEAAIQQAQKQEAQWVAFVKSDEYKQTQERIKEAESFFESESAEIEAEFFAIQKRIEAAREMHRGYKTDLIKLTQPGTKPAQTIDSNYVQIMSFEGPVSNLTQRINFVHQVHAHGKEIAERGRAFQAKRAQEEAAKEKPTIIGQVRDMLRGTRAITTQ